MASIKLILLLAVIAMSFQEIYGHGKMSDPANRSSLWKLQQYAGLVPDNYNDNENYCGGFAVQYNSVNRGKCGPCGDHYQDPIPRKNENGGLYGKGYVVKNYKQAQKITVTIDLTTNHLGYFEFSICKLANANAIETEECFEQYPLKVIQNGQIVDKYQAGDSKGDIKIEVLLPENLTCDRCVLRWHYRVGNNWDFCDASRTVGRLGCGNQETFRSCADIAID